MNGRPAAHLTGSGLKDPETARTLPGRTYDVPAELSAVATALGWV